MVEDGFIEEISDLFTGNRIGFHIEDHNGIRVFRALGKDSNGISRNTVTIIPVPLTARNIEEAAWQSTAVRDVIRKYNGAITVVQDRWQTSRKTISYRLLAHLGIFRGIFARDCEVRKISRAEADRFLEQCHSYGGAKSRYCYGIFLKRDRVRLNNTTDSALTAVTQGTMVAAAEFSNARRWIKSDKEIRSYEWIRYASIPDVRINGGMGKVMKHFIADVHPDDIMSYADLEWSDGQAYTRMGFVLEGEKSPVTFMIDTESMERRTVGKDTSAVDRQYDNTAVRNADKRYFQNFGSLKYRLKLY